MIHYPGYPGCSCVVCKPPGGIPPEATTPVTPTHVPAATDKPWLKQATFVGQGARSETQQPKKGNEAEPPAHWLKQRNAWDGWLNERGEVEHDDGGPRRFDNNVKSKG